MNPYEHERHEAVDAALGRLLGPGGPFELAEEDVLGTLTPVFVHRDRSLPDVLARSLAYGHRDYIVTTDERISFAEHGIRVASLARGLREEYGVSPGDRVGIVAANTPGWLLTFWAAVLLGAVPVAYNAWWSTRELGAGIADSRPRVVIADRRRAPLVSDSRVSLLSLEEDLPRLIASWPSSTMEAPTVDEDDPAVILCTSGTSGRPKGVVHTHRNLLAVVEFHRLLDALHAALGDDTDPRDHNYLLSTPLFHIGALHNLAVPRLATGSTVTMHLGAFDVDSVMGLVERERITHWGAVPTMAARLLEHPDLGVYDTSSLTAFALSSAPAEPGFQERLRARLPFASHLVDSYGLTESCTAVTSAGPADLADSPGTLGAPIPGVRLEIRDPLGEVLPAGQEGEICTLSAYNMLGYWEDETATRRAFDNDRWLRTGDLGVLDAQGRVRLTARRSDLIIRGGENIYPAEVEGVLIEHPDVDECAVHGTADEDLGQQVAVVVVSGREDRDVLAAELRSWTGDRMASYKVPTRWRITTAALPRNAMGKVLRHRVTSW